MTPTDAADALILIIALQNDLAAARLELRRLRAAEAPGTDDAAFEGTGWERHHEWHRGWVHRDARVYRHDDGLWRVLGHNRTFRFALDAMRAAVLGSV